MVRLALLLLAFFVVVFWAFCWSIMLWRWLEHDRGLNGVAPSEDNEIRVLFIRGSSGIHSNQYR